MDISAREAAEERPHLQLQAEAETRPLDERRESSVMASKPLPVDAGKKPAASAPLASELPPFDIGSDLKRSNLTDHQKWVYKAVRTVRPNHF